MIAVYLHIPFCNTICSYCDFCKLYYDRDWVNKYLKALEQEIEKKYQGEPVKTLYIGGGTPTALTIDELIILFDIIKLFNLSALEEFTIEGNVENLSKDKLLLFKKNKVNRLSIGIQSFNDKHLHFLGRNYSQEDIFKAIETAQQVGFNNINVDLIYGLPIQTLDDLKEDVNFFLKLNINHISAYSLIIEEHTKLSLDKVKDIDDDLNYEMYQYLNQILPVNGYHHYEISNYAKDGYESKHNLTYWNNDQYYGFGLGASSFYKQQRYTNTRSLTNYFEGKYIYERTIMDQKTLMQNELILGLRKLEGVNKESFYNKYHVNIKDIFMVDNLIKDGSLKENDKYLYIPEDKIFISNEILLNFID